MILLDSFAFGWVMAYIVMSIGLTGPAHERFEYHFGLTYALAWFVQAGSQFAQGHPLFGAGFTLYGTIALWLWWNNDHTRRRRRRLKNAVKRRIRVTSTGRLGVSQT